MNRFRRRPTLLLSAEDTEFCEGVLEACNAMGWRIASLNHVLDHLIPHLSPVGAILARIPWGRQLELIREIGIPIVCASGLADVEFQQDGRVYYDRYGAGRCAANAFVERGFRDLAYVGFGSGELASDPLAAGLREVAEMNEAVVHSCRLPPTGKAEDSDAIHDEQLRTLVTFLEEKPKPLAILAYNYRMAVRIISACNLADIAIPEEVVIACLGNHRILYEMAPVSLSGIDMNSFEHGRQAVRLMKQIVDGAPIPAKPVIVPVKGFVERRSTEILAVSDPKVAKAMRFIWDHVDQPLQVDDVAREAGVSRRVIERAFRRCLNRGIKEELRRKRMEISRELLRSSKMTIEEIADAVGFSSRRDLHRAFRVAFGITPNEYRKSLRPREK